MSHEYAIKGGVSNTLVDIDNVGLFANFPASSALAGALSFNAEGDAGDYTGIRQLRALRMNEYGNCMHGLDTLLFHEVFPGTTLNAAQWFYSTSIQTSQQAGGFVTLNATASVAVNGSTVISSYKTIPLVPETGTYIQFRAKLFGQALSYKVMELGCGYAATLAAPTDGVFFRWTQAGELRGVCVVGSLATGGPYELLTDPMPMPNDGEVHYYLVNWNMRHVTFWIDDKIVGRIDTPQIATGSSTHFSKLQAPMRAVFAPIIMRSYIPNVANCTPAFAPRMFVSYVVAGSTGGTTTKTAAETAVGCWHGHCQCGQSGFATLTSQSNWSNSPATATMTLSNTAVGASALGGIFQFAAAAGATTDYALFGFPVPVWAATVQPKSLHITDVYIDAVVIGAAITTTPTVLVWALAAGGTSMTLAAADGAATNAFRKIPLGTQVFPLGAPVGTKANTVKVTFATPIVVPPGKWLDVAMQMPVGSATASQFIRGQVSINGYWSW